MCEKCAKQFLFKGGTNVMMGWGTKILEIGGLVLMRGQPLDWGLRGPPTPIVIVDSPGTIRL